MPGDPGVPAGMTSTYYKAFAPRIGIAWSPGNSGKTSIRAGWGLFYNPMEQLVLAQFGAEPPFGDSIIPALTQFNLPFLGQDGATTYLNPYGGFLTPQRGTAQDWAQFEPIALYGEFQPHLRTQYSAQYNFTIQRELSKDMKLQVGYVGSQGHRLLATHDLNYGNSQTCLDLQALEDNYPGPASADPGLTCAQFYADTGYLIPTQWENASGTGMENVQIPAQGLHLPYTANGGGPAFIPGGTSVSSIAPNGITPGRPSSLFLAPVRPLTGSGCPASFVPVFSSIFAQDTIASSAYNSLQVSLEKRMAQGLQFSAAYTYSKSIDEASSVEGILNPLPGARNYALSLFDARHRVVISYQWDLPIRKYSGFTGKLLDGWSLSGITTYQTGFPIRITSSSDNELMYSADFEYPGATQIRSDRSTGRSLKNNGSYYFNSPD